MTETTEKKPARMVWLSPCGDWRLCQKDGEMFFEHDNFDAMGEACWIPASIGGLHLNEILNSLVRERDVAETARDQFQALVNAQDNA